MSMMYHKSDVTYCEMRRVKKGDSSLERIVSGSSPYTIVGIGLNLNLFQSEGFEMIDPHIHI